MPKTGPADRWAIPRDKVNDYTDASAAIRRRLICDRAGVDLAHVAKYSFDPSILQGNIENFIGWRKCRSASPARFASTVSMRREIF